MAFGFTRKNLPQIRFQQIRKFRFLPDDFEPVGFPRSVIYAFLLVFAAFFNRNGTLLGKTFLVVKQDIIEMRRVRGRFIPGGAQINLMFSVHHNFMPVGIEGESGFHDDFLPGVGIRVRTNVQATYYPPSNSQSVKHPALFIQVSLLITEIPDGHQFPEIIIISLEFSMLIPERC